jgi:Domain of unknown function (DUF3859)
VRTSLILAAFFSLLSNFSFAQVNTKYRVRFKELSYRVCTSTALEKTQVNVTIEYILECSGNGKIMLQETWIFPRVLSDEKGSTYSDFTSQVEKAANENISSSYTMIQNSELVKGKWKFKLTYRGALLCEKEFSIQ